LPALEETLVHHSFDYVEADEMWLFIGKKKQVFWLWLAVSYQTRQILAFALGNRSAKSAKALWKLIPKKYRRKKIYTDGLASYASALPKRLHRPCAKGTGLTNTVERTNLTLRQRVGSLVRKSLSFAKSEKHLYNRLRWYIHQHNLEKAKLYRKHN